MHSLSKILVRGLVAFALLAPAAFVGGASPVSAAALGATGACATGIGNGGGQGIICDVTIVNTITATGGWAKVTVHQCLGAFGAETSGVCSTTTKYPTEPVTSVTQCDYSVLGGGSKLLCSVVITNNFYGIDPGSSAVTVDQCIGSATGGGSVMVCNPLQATSNAAITQCNGSATGGGESVTCTATGTMASARAVTIDQCNNSAAPGAGSVIVCSATMTDHALALPAPTAPSSTGRLPAPTTTVDAGSSSNSTPLLPLMLVLALGGFVLAAVVTTKRRGVRN
jgi:hypothetical protein